jgi:hypothetical protein
MDRTPESYLTLAGELDLAWRRIQGQLARNRDATARLGADGQPTEHDWAALGYTLHNLYNALENYFLRVAKFFENSLDAPTWHRDLVDRMTMAIAGVRPALLPDSVRPAVHELRAFRHVFRSLYDSILDPDRVLQANAQATVVVAAMERAHLTFIEKLRSIAAGL